MNALIALVDLSHVHHGPADRWFDTVGHKSWASCPITENGVIRIVGNSQYANFPGNAASVVDLMKEFVTLPGHIFWPDDVSLLDAGKIDALRLLTATQVTDTYLLALAQAHGGKLATLDRRLIVDAVSDGAKSLAVIG